MSSGSCKQPRKCVGAHPLAISEHRLLLEATATDPISALREVGRIMIKLSVKFVVLFAWNIAGSYICAQDELPLPSLSNCSQYTHREALLSCPPGLRFDSITLSCAAEEKAECASAAVKRIVSWGRKCCAVGEQLNAMFRCETSETSWYPTLHWLNPNNHSDLVSSEFVPQRMHMGPMNSSLCRLKLLNADRRSLSSPIKLHLLTSGWLFVPQAGIKYAPQTYCIDQMAVEGRTIVAGAVCQQFIPKYMRRVNEQHAVLPRCCPRGYAMVSQARGRANTLQCIYEPNSVLFPSYMQEVNTSVERMNLDENVRYGTLCENTSLGQIDPKFDPFYISSKAVLKLRYKNISVESDSYCINEIKLISLSGKAVYKPTAFVCAPKVNEIAVSPRQDSGKGLRKCCPIGYSLMLWHGVVECVASHGEDQTNNLTLLLEALDPSLRTSEIRYGTPVESWVLSRSDETVFVNRDGRLEIFTSEGCRLSVHETYCVDRLSEGSRLIALFTMPYKGNKTAKPFILGLFGVAFFFLVVTFLVYLFVPAPIQLSLNKKRRLSQTVLGMILLSYVSAFTISYLMVVITVIDNYTHSARIVIGVLTYFFFTATFFWLSALYFEIYWSTRSCRLVSGTKRFRLYSLYAWLSPISLSLICIIIDFTPGIGCSVVKPGFGIRRCFFETMEAQLLYFYLPTGVVLFFCVIIFLLTVRNISSAPRMSALSMSVRICEQTKQRQAMLVKLFFSMGLPWFFEILESWIEMGVFQQLRIACSLMQPFFIFLTFVAHPNILRYLKKTLTCNGTGQVVKNQLSTAATISAPANNT